MNKRLWSFATRLRGVGARLGKPHIKSKPQIAPCRDLEAEIVGVGPRLPNLQKAGTQLVAKDGALWQQQQSHESGDKADHFTVPAF